jgi:hypothetical protein
MGQQNPKPQPPPLAMGKMGGNDQLSAYTGARYLTPQPIAPLQDFIQKQMPFTQSPNSVRRAEAVDGARAIRVARLNPYGDFYEGGVGARNHDFVSIF